MKYSIKRRFGLFLICFFLTGCQFSAGSLEPASVFHTYPGTDTIILNPERGFFVSFRLPGSVDFSSLRDQGYTLVHLNIHLDPWIQSDVPQQVIDGLYINFAELRKAGCKAIIRFTYNKGYEADASREWVLRHIDQFRSLLHDNADVIAWVEAGFIGAWGEWHDSTNGLDNVDDKRKILSALLRALPETRMVQVRRPYDIIRMFPNPADAVQARVAHHNDCFLSSDTDVGTYEHDGLVTIEIDQAYLAALTRYTPMSGETCAPNPPRSDCPAALHEMALLHYSALSGKYHQEVLDRWKAGGCMEEISRRLGYRLILQSSSFNEQIRPGGIFSMKVDLQNSGFASMVNKRPLYVVFKEQGNSSIYRVKLDLDPRTWEPGRTVLTVRLRIPSNLPIGTYMVNLWLPDEYPAIAENPLYAVRFVNKDVWEETTGFNRLGIVKIVEGTTGSYQRGEQFRILEQSSSTDP